MKKFCLQKFSKVVYILYKDNNFFFNLISIYYIIHQIYLSNKFTKNVQLMKNSLKRLNHNLDKFGEKLKMITWINLVKKFCLQKFSKVVYILYKDNNFFFNLISIYYIIHQIYLSNKFTKNVQLMKNSLKRLNHNLDKFGENLR